MKTPDVSILISMGAGRERHFDVSLSSLTRHEFDKEKVELLVFLDYSNASDTILIINRYRGFFNSVRCFCIIKKKGVVSHSASRRNFLATKAKGRYIVFCEPEMLHVNSTLPLIFDFISKEKTNCWYCGPVYATASVVDRNGHIIVDEYQTKEDVDFLLDLALKYRDNFYNNKIKRFYFRIDEKEYPHPFFCTLLSKDFFFKLGGLNQNLKVRGWEEIEFFKRFCKKGGKVYFDEQFITCHLPHKRTLHLETQVGWDIYNSNCLFDPNQKMGAITEQTREVVLR